MTRTAGNDQNPGNLVIGKFEIIGPNIIAKYGSITDQKSTALITLLASYLLIVPSQASDHAGKYILGNCEVMFLAMVIIFRGFQTLASPALRSELNAVAEQYDPLF